MCCRLEQKGATSVISPQIKSSFCVDSYFSKNHTKIAPNTLALEAQIRIIPFVFLLWGVLLSTIDSPISYLLTNECPDSCYLSDVVLTEASGSLLYDQHGRQYIDLCAGFGSLALGHLPIISKEPINYALGDLYPSRAKVELLAMLRTIMPPYLSRVALAVTGSQAIDLVIKTALLATGSSNFICLTNCYHGLDFGSLSLSSNNFFKHPFRSWLNDSKVKHIEINCPLTDLEQCIDQQNGTAGVIVEPVQGRGGGYACSDKWLQEVAGLCRNREILLIYDEIFSGLGRCGQLTKSFTVEADLICLGKILGGGMPISAVIGREDVMQAWPRNRGEALHSGTFFGQSLACRSASNTLQKIIDHDLVNRSKQLGEEARDYLSNHLPKCYQIRGQGLLVVIDLGQPRYGVALAERLRHQGVIAIPAGIKGQCLSLSPALNIPRQLLFEALAKISHLLTKISTPANE